jgi:hypothetical protein
MLVACVRAHSQLLVLVQCSTVLDGNRLLIQSYAGVCHSMSCKYRSQIEQYDSAVTAVVTGMHHMVRRAGCVCKLYYSIALQRPGVSAAY